MNESFLEGKVAQSGWMEPAGKVLNALEEATVQKMPGGVKDFLHGKWLGHPLHSALVSLPIGAFTSAVVLDFLGSFRRTHRYEAGADAAVRLGLISTCAAAATGLTDWSKTDKPARQVGVVHALFNTSAAAFFLGSWILRRQQRRQGARSTGVAGLLLLLGGAYVGGRLVYDYKIGVDHAEHGGPAVFTPVMPEAELPENTPHRVEAGGVGILLVRQEGRIYAIGERCAHLGGPLAEGHLEGGTIRCPWHGSRFELSDGKVLEGPATHSQPCFETRVNHGQIEVRINTPESLPSSEVPRETQRVS